MTTLADKIAEAEAKLEELRRRAAFASCAEIGHDWKCLGGCNAGCGDECVCSVPVHECSRCKGCDYGENNEATEVRRLCAQNRL
jgi:hypothetical protein